MRIEIPPALPLFPLTDTVLFPHMPLPLHIFEDRYRRMVADVLAGHGTIGMVLEKPGERRPSAHPEVFAVGCAGRLERCDPLEDGRFNILLRGITRFRIDGEQGGALYRIARVSPLQDSLGDAAALDEARRRVLDVMSVAQDGPAVLVLHPELPHERLVNALGQSLPLTGIEKQSLLECDVIAERYRRLLELLEFKRLEASLGRSEPGRLH
jgi:Lon protease-like protein